MCLQSLLPGINYTWYFSVCFWLLMVLLLYDLCVVTAFTPGNYLYLIILLCLLLINHYVCYSQNLQPEMWHKRGFKSWCQSRKSAKCCWRSCACSLPPGATVYFMCKCARVCKYSYGFVDVVFCIFVVHLCAYACLGVCCERGRASVRSCVVIQERVCFM